jgi:hypothetical protein
VTRARTYLGLITGVLLILSSGAHSLVGWNAMSDQLQRAQVPNELQQGLAAGWHYGGAMMLTIGLIVAWLFWQRLKGRPVSTAPAALVALVYLVFSSWALVTTGEPAFALVFFVPGVLLAIASYN